MSRPDISSRIMPPSRKRTPFDFEVEEMDGLDTGPDDVVVAKPSAVEEEGEDLADLQFEMPGQQYGEDVPEPQPRRRAAGSSRRPPPPPPDDPEPQEATEDDDVEEADVVEAAKRIELANLWREVMASELFDPRQSGWAQQRIQREIRRFARQQLETLLGMRAATVGSAGPWTREQVEVLTQLANKLLSSEVRPIAQVKPTTVKPVLQQRAPQVQLRAPSPKQQATQAQHPKPQAPAKPQAPKAPAPRPPPATTQAAQPQQRPEVPDNLSEAYKNDPTLTLVDGRWKVQLRDPDGEPLWVKDKGNKRVKPMWKDVHPPVKPTGMQPLPMPSLDQVAMIMQNHADRAISAAEARSVRGNYANHLTHTVVSNLAAPSEQ